MHRSWIWRSWWCSCPDKEVQGRAAMDDKSGEPRQLFESCQGFEELGTSKE